MKFDKTDALSIFSEIKKQHKHIKLKRRFLLAFPPTKSERRKLKKSKFFQKEFLSESLLREDDLFYDTVRAHVESAFGASEVGIDDDLLLDDMHLINMPKVKLKRLILSVLDNLSTKGLYLLAKIVADGSVKCEKTRHNLKQTIKGSLSSALGSKRLNHRQLESRKQIFHLLSNPQQFRIRCEPFSVLKSESCHAAAVKVLRRLESFPSKTLIAMYNKLKGVKCTHQLQPCKHGWGRDKLIKLLNKTCREMLFQLDSKGDLQEPLAKAMAVADLSLKLTLGRDKIFAREFYQFPPEIKSLQTNIMNAIWSVKNEVTLPVLRNLQLLIEPEAKISNRSLRTAFVNLLTEFLFECVDMDSIPKSLSHIIAVIHKNSKITDNVVFSRKYIDKEVDYILGISAQTKQIVLDLLPDHGFDQDFTDAYGEELEESDDSDSGIDDDDNDKLHEDRIYSNYEAESIGDFAPVLFQPSTSIKEEDVSFCPSTTSGRFCGASPNREYTENVVNKPALHESTDVDMRDSSCMSCVETEPTSTKQSIDRNQYLAIQDACDKTSMLAYNLVGHLLKEFAIIEGLDIKANQRLYLSSDNAIEDIQEMEHSSSGNTESSAVIQVVKELVPALPDSAMEKLKILMS
ncbi:uncharacterized protein LOC107628967 [Arachis ipaensis]|uniref:uncharacterized protein LOC107628967 n=1 Tax=Arachis ipaensis TaxID=130454 RepID=UPI0007AFA62B|nr:uncharacterized protein LOC107628967 [Arachis ipaensis]XP_016187106.1 uncharacterized protein LOC107628967 [Arachis ipaensis]XP_020973586.1 uncharacterized protein LOC107628967 [Arachis ipaensis]XP_020973587.1 uncharacterized protein LOC107628967 [Arachis ipaensis]